MLIPEGKYAQTANLFGFLYEQTRELSIYFIDVWHIPLLAIASFTTLIGWFVTANQTSYILFYFHYKMNAVKESRDRPTCGLETRQYVGQRGALDGFSKYGKQHNQIKNQKYYRSNYVPLLIHELLAKREVFKSALLLKKIQKYRLIPLLLYLVQGNGILSLILLQSDDMRDDGGDVRVVLYHFLVVAATLVGRTGPNCLAHHHVNLGIASLDFSHVEKLKIVGEKVHVGSVFCKRPQGGIEVLPFCAFLAAKPRFFVIPGFQTYPFSQLDSHASRARVLLKSRGGALF